MRINTDISILGGLKDFNLILHLIEKSDGFIADNSSVQMYSSVKTNESYRRFTRAIEDNFLKYRNSNIQDISVSILNEEHISPDSLLLLFWNASSNNDLIHYLNQQSYFPAFYSGRLILKKDDASACIKDLKQSEQALGGWSVETIDTVSSISKMENNDKPVSKNHLKALPKIYNIFDGDLIPFWLREKIMHILKDNKYSLEAIKLVFR